MRFTWVWLVSLFSLFRPGDLNILLLAPVGKRVWCFVVQYHTAYLLFIFLVRGSGMGLGWFTLFFVVFDSPVSRSHGWLIFLSFWVASSMYIPWIRGTDGVLLRRVLGFCGLSIRLYPVFILYGCFFGGDLEGEVRAPGVGLQRDGWDVPGADVSWGSGGQWSCGNRV